MTRPIVLVVDDSPEDAATVERLIRLAEPECEVEVCFDAQQALDWLWRRTPSLVLLDIRMPGFDGLELLQRVKQNPCTVTFPVVVVTGTLRSEEGTACKRAGAAAVVRKQVDADAFATELIATARPWLSGGT